MRHLLACLLLWALAVAWADTETAELPVPSNPEVLFRRVRAWADVAQPLAVLRLAQPPSSLHYVPGWHDSSPPRFLAVGDTTGGLLLLSPGGQLLAQHATGTASPITAVGSYRLGRNATVLLSGHASGELRLHLLRHPPAPGGGSQGGWEDAEDEWEAAAAAGRGDGAPLRLTLLESLPSEALFCGCSSSSSVPGTCAAAGSEASAASRAAETAGAAGAAAKSRSHCPPIASMHGSGRGGSVASTVVVTDAAGALAVLKHGGPGNTGVRIVRRSLLAQQPVAVRLPPLATVAAVMGSSGVAAHRLGPVPAAAKPESGTPGQQGGAPGLAQPASGAAAVPQGFEAGPAFRPCSSLNGSNIVAAAFDAVHGSRAYAVGDDGRLLALVVGGGDRGAPAGCTVRMAVPLHAALVQAARAGASASSSSSSRSSDSTLLPGAVNMDTLPGYLLVTVGDRLAVYNVSSAPRRVPRLLLQQHLIPLLRQLSSAGSAGREGQHGREQRQAGQAAGADEPVERDGRAAAPLLAASHSHVALTLGPRVLALFEASLPYRPHAQPYRASLAWMQLLQPAAMIMVAAFVLHRARSKRGGGGGGRGGGGAGLGGDPRLREFERLLQDPMAGAAVPRRQRAGLLRSGRAGGSSDSSGSDVEDSLLGTLPPNRSGSAGDAVHAELAARRRGGLLGPRPASSNGGAGDKARQAQRQRAAALAAADDADIRALRAELAGSALGDAELAGEPADVDMTELAPAELGDEISLLRRRLNQAHL